MRMGGIRLERVERKGKAYYYLVKDLRAGGKKFKVTKFIGAERPSAEKLEKLIENNLLELELKAIRKKVSVSSQTFRTEPFGEDGAQFIMVMESFRLFYLAFRELLTVNEAERYEEQLEHEYVGGTTAIEGNTLTLRETHLLLKEGIVPDKSLREINEVQNFRAVKRLRDSYKGQITMDLIRRFHSLIMCNIDIESAGCFRKVDDVVIIGREGSLCPSVLIEEELQQALDEHYGSLEQGTYPFIAAVRFHHRFECIHPFTDGNGRVGREVFNLMLMMNKYPRVVFLGKDRKLYLNALAKGDDGDERGMVQAFAELLINQRRDIIFEKATRMGVSIESMTDDGNVQKVLRILFD